MPTLPLRLASLIFLALFCHSRLVRRLVAAVAVSCVFVAAQHGGVMQALAALASG